MYAHVSQVHLSLLLIPFKFTGNVPSQKRVSKSNTKIWKKHHRTKRREERERAWKRDTEKERNRERETKEKRKKEKQKKRQREERDVFGTTLWSPVPQRGSLCAGAVSQAKSRRAWSSQGESTGPLNKDLKPARQNSPCKRSKAALLRLFLKLPV